jgi:hypothetical protein
MAINQSIINTREGERGFSGQPNVDTPGLSGYSGYSGFFIPIPYIADATAEDVVEKFNLLVDYLLEKGWIIYEEVPEG